LVEYLKENKIDYETSTNKWKMVFKVSEEIEILHGEQEAVPEKAPCYHVSICAHIKVVSVDEDGNPTLVHMKFNKRFGDSLLFGKFVSKLMKAKLNLFAEKEDKPKRS